MKKEHIQQQLTEIIEYLNSAKPKAKAAAEEYIAENINDCKYKHSYELGALGAYVEHAALKLEILLKTL